jgi:hypothetical protein
MRKQVILASLFVAATAAVAGAQTFSSGSTGADGALNVTADTTLPLPANGIFNFTTVTVQAGMTLTFAKNASNTPVVILATGDVLINGAITVNAGGLNIDGVDDPRIPGCGGFAGGGPGEPGTGPGAGTVASYVATWVGPLSLVPIVGGSGGANGGGGGGGAIVIASTGKITVAGAVNALGRANGGSGGAIRLVANRVEVTSGSMAALGCASCCYWCGWDGYRGLIRIEAPVGQTYLAAPGNITPAAVLTVPNPEIVRGDPTLLSIVSVAGQPVPAGAGSRTTVADILLPSTIADDLPVVVNAVHIPVGTEVTLGFLTSARGTVVTATLAGTYASSTATLHVTGLNRGTGVVTAFYVTAVFAVPPSGGGGSGAPDPDAVAQVRVTASLGEPMRYVFLRADGSEVDPARVPAELRARFTR